MLFGNGLVAILAGLLANTLVTTLDLGPVAPFDAAFIILIIGGAIISFTWRENYGEKKNTVAGKSGEVATEGVLKQFSDAVACIRGDVRVALLGVMQVRAL